MQTAYSKAELEYAAVTYWFMNISLCYSILISWYRLFSYFSLYCHYLNETPIMYLGLNSASSSVAAVTLPLRSFLLITKDIEECLKE